jgi:IclR family transcriptional regulator, acetate operon repressor
MEVTQADESEPTIRSVERALRLITAAVEAPDGIGLIEAARLTELAPSTATRILRTLEAARFVARRDDDSVRCRPQSHHCSAPRNPTSTNSP